MPGTRRSSYAGNAATGALDSSSARLTSRGRACSDLWARASPPLPRVPTRARFSGAARPSARAPTWCTSASMSAGVLGSTTPLTRRCSLLSGEGSRPSETAPHASPSTPHSKVAVVVTCRRQSMIHKEDRTVAKQFGLSPPSGETRERGARGRGGLRRRMPRRRGRCEHCAPGTGRPQRPTWLRAASPLRRPSRCYAARTQHRGELPGRSPSAPALRRER
jgi:hypothetical protein